MTGFTHTLGRIHLAPGKGERWVRQATYDPLASTEIPALNESRAAAVGRDVCQRVLAAQGHDGKLARRHLEKKSPIGAMTKPGRSPNRLGRQANRRVRKPPREKSTCSSRSTPGPHLVALNP